MSAVIRPAAIGLLVFAAATTASIGARWGAQRIGWSDTERRPMAGLVATDDATSGPIPVADLPAGNGAIARHDRNPLRSLRQLPVDGLASHQAASSTFGGGAAETARLGALLLIDGAAQPVHADRPIALPTGTRLQLQVTSPEPAVLELRAIAPDGRSEGAPLWQALLAANAPAVSPALRLMGMPGVETLRLVRRSLLTGEVVEQRVQVLHHAG